MKQSKQINYRINSNIKVGDKVILFDGSALSLIHSNKDLEDQDYFIVWDYPELGFNEPLKEYEFTVIQTNILDYVCGEFLHLQDIIVECNGIKFRTASGFVKKV